MEQIIKDMQETIDIYTERSKRLLNSRRKGEYQKEDHIRGDIYGNCAHEIKIWLRRIQEVKHE